MTAVAWPGSLPKRFLRDGYTESPAENLIRNPMDVGPAKTRRRSTVAPVRVTGSMLMDDAQLATFKTFYTSIVFYGTVAFAMKDQLGFLREMSIVEPPVYTTLPDALRTSVGLVLEYIP